MSKENTTRVLLVEDTPSLSIVYQEYLSKAGVKTELAETGADALRLLESGRFRVVLLDLKLPDMNGIDILKQITERGLPAAVVVITADGSINTAVDAMRLGAYDFIVKPFSEDRLITTTRNALERIELQATVETIRDDFGRDRFQGFIGSSLSMQGVYRAIESVARSKATVFVTGESGTGKEVCAEAIHRASPRKSMAFVPLNCAAIPKDLIESEIFGHLKGAFTGATSDRSGAASQAHGGTLFLDEICEMDLALQTKLLRFLQTGKIQPVGGDKLQAVDVRIICATNRDPAQEVEEGRFREDLFYRLHVVPIHLPPLRERQNDPVEIAQTFLRDYAKEESKAFKGFAPETETALLNHTWPGNVRELQNVIRNTVVLHDGEEVLPEMLPQSLGNSPVLQRPESGAEAPRVAAQSSRMITGPANGALGSANQLAGSAFDIAGLKLWQIEKQAIEATIAACGGSIPKAATQLGISPSTIYRKKESWDAQGSE
ncbi:sigma-54 dependent transcriptional regulator [Pelagibius sp. Alg239-R121]|uniref:sigma-54-dependent transcriptional regulator n=1 Tax=Pelagibius sp. Alg239-R121 TaxID=2993448 RepID=UPI0024A75185|nr:sigma-54 dependent transcriptional regulator [Pelagibius sp. Alg239-R121]